MEDDTPSPLPHFRRQATERVRQRIYVALIVALAVFVGGLLFWPLNAELFRTYAEITLQIQPERPTGAVLNAAQQDRDTRLQTIIRDCLSDEILANTIRQATFVNNHGVAQFQVSDIRRHLSVGVTRDKTAESSVRWVQVIWTGQSSPGVQRFVNALSEEIANRAARDIRTDSIQLQLEERFDQIASERSDQSARLASIVEHAKQQIERQRLTLLALQQQVSSLGSSDATGGDDQLVLQDQVDAIKQQVLNSDAHLLTLLRQQVIHHFEVDENDGLVQHIGRLIEDRQNVLAQLSDAITVDATNTSTAATDNNRSQVRTNPFVMASAEIRRTAASPAQLTEIQATANELQLEPLVSQMQELQEILTTALDQKLPVINLSSQLERETSSYRVVQVQPARVSLPLDAAPKQQWAFGLSVLALMIGTAFSLQTSPQSLARTLFRPSQLARYLGIDHLGTIRTGKPQPNVIDNMALLFGRRVFQAAEVVVLLAVGSIFVAMIWEPSLPSIIAQHPLEGLCQAFWILMGR
ncbi:MAG: hypothetical protein JNK57_09805 [Planctomycetaceae bacterium]|nr:hypothetical protein [Planctomycetaceae bacterium]